MSSPTADRYCELTGRSSSTWSSVQPRIIFITGTDTGVGKTVLTTLLLAHLRNAAAPAFALKPFCSGGRADAQLLRNLQDGDLTLDQINPFHFHEPLAPLVAARLHHRKISLKQTLSHIRHIRSQLRTPRTPPRLGKITYPPIRQSTNPVLLIEGAGGLLAPLGEGFTAADLIKKLRCEVIIASANRLGAINHSSLTVLHLQAFGVQKVTLVLMDIDRDSRITHHASRTNPQILSELIDPIPIFHLPHIPELAESLGKTERKLVLITCAKKLKKTLAQIIQ